MRFRSSAGSDINLDSFCWFALTNMLGAESSCSAAKSRTICSPPAGTAGAASSDLNGAKPFASNCSAVVELRRFRGLTEIGRISEDGTTFEVGTIFDAGAFFAPGKIPALRTAFKPGTIFEG